MALTSSIIEDSSQSDSRRQIRELHVDSFGIQHRASYLGAANENAQANLAVRATQIEADLAAQELENNEQEILNGDL